jgi:hypothetical protein
MQDGLAPVAASSGRHLEYGPSAVDAAARNMGFCGAHPLERKNRLIPRKRIVIIADRLYENGNLG